MLSQANSLRSIKEMLIDNGTQLNLIHISAALTRMFKLPGGAPSPSEAIPLLMTVKDKILSQPELLDGFTSWGPTCVLSTCNRLGYHREGLFRVVAKHIMGNLGRMKSHEIVLVVRALEEAEQGWAAECIPQEKVRN